MSHVGTTNEERPMRVPCPHCGEKTRVTNTNVISPATREVYCNCLNPDCDARVIMVLGHKHDVRPPKNEMEGLVAEVLRRMSPGDLQKLLTQA